MSNLKKTAVDSVAEEYWRSYYADSGYGELWVRTIPKRIKASLEKTAKVGGDLQISPISTCIGKDGVSLEGLVVFPNGKKKAFVADFDHSGKVLDLEALDLE